jgi:hypothetical protein
LAGIVAPSRAEDPEFREWFMRAERMSASPQAMLNVLDTISRTDVRDVLGSAILTSSTVKDLVVGSGIEFTARGTKTLKG